jgi:hypothetical protein
LIYFVQPRGRPFVKIGHARRVQTRVADLQTAAPDELVLLGVVAGGLAREAVIHARFAHLQVRGEWFHYTREVRLFLEAVAEHYQPQVHDPEASSEAGRQEWEASLKAVRALPGDHGRRVRVWVQRSRGRANLMLQWHDPDTGKRRSKTAGTMNRDEAELRRADLEATLNLSIRDSSRNSASVEGPAPGDPAPTPPAATPSPASE